MKIYKKIASIISQNFNSFVEDERVYIHYSLSTAHRNAVLSEIYKSLKRNNGFLVNNDTDLNGAVPGLAVFVNEVNKEFFKVYNVKSKPIITIDIYLKDQLNSAVLPENKKSDEIKSFEKVYKFKDCATIAHKSRLILRNLGLRSIFSIAIGIPSFIIFSALKLAYYTASTLLQIPAAIIAHPFSKKSTVIEREDAKAPPLSSNIAQDYTLPISELKKPRRKTMINGMTDNVNHDNSEHKISNNTSPKPKD